VSIDWGEVYTSVYDELVRFLDRKVWDRERAQDLAQETFARAIGQQPDNPRAWLFRVAANLARDETRLVVRRRRHLALLWREPELGGTSAPCPSTLVEDRERAELIRQALDRLGERDQNVLLLWNAGLTYSEIAAEIGLAPGAISNTLARALKRLGDAHHALEEEHAARG
jgi:RNA polymerase sigma-70 factor (ECF subfamily)